MAKRPRPADIFSRWHHLIENLQASPMEFYSQVEAALQKRQIPDIKTSRVDWREGGLLSAKREYLRVRRKEFVFDICGAPFGTGFFFSWWLGELPSGFWALVSLIPLFGPLMIWAFRRETYYKNDTALMFQDTVHSAVMEILDGMSSAKGLRVLSELERKPIMREFARR